MWTSIWTLATHSPMLGTGLVLLKGVLSPQLDPSVLAAALDWGITPIISPDFFFLLQILLLRAPKLVPLLHLLTYIPTHTRLPQALRLLSPDQPWLPESGRRIEAWSDDVDDGAPYVFRTKGSSDWRERKRIKRKSQWLTQQSTKGIKGNVRMVMRKWKKGLVMERIIDISSSEKKIDDDR